MLKIVSVPNEVLTTPVKPVAAIDAKISKLVKEMTETLNIQVDPQGVGLAATQVGVGLALFIIKPRLKAKTETFINPRIIETISAKPKKKKKNGSMQLEGCLSIARIWGPIDRAPKVFLEYQNLKGEKKKEWFSGFKAMIIQHEVDHLHGILFTQRALEQGQQLYREENGKLKKVEF